MCRLTSIVVLGSLVATPVFAQTAREVAGHIKDSESGNPVPSVAVVLGGTTFSTLTGTDGRFSFKNIPAAKYVMKLEHIAYGTRTATIDVTSSQKLNVEIVLDPKPVSVEGVTVTVVSEEARPARASASRLVIVPEEKITEAAERGRKLPELLRQETGLRVRYGRFSYMNRGEPRPTRICIESRRGGTNIAGLSTSSTSNAPFCEMIALAIDDVIVEDPGAMMSAMDITDLTSIELLSPADATQRFGLGVGDSGAVLLYTKRGIRR